MRVVMHVDGTVGLIMKRKDPDRGLVTDVLESSTIGGEGGASRLGLRSIASGPRASTALFLRARKRRRQAAEAAAVAQKSSGFKAAAAAVTVTTCSELVIYIFSTRYYYVRVGGRFLASYQ